MKSDVRGASLLEVVIASCLISTLAISLGYILQQMGGRERESTLRHVAAGLARDSLEILRIRPFGYLYPTSAGDAPGDGCLASQAAYDRDPSHFPPEDIRWGNLTFRRSTCLEFVAPHEDQLERHASDDETGLKRIIVKVSWPADRPREDYQLESLVQDPKGPPRATKTTSVLQTSVQCKSGLHTAEPCAGILFQMTDDGGALVSSALSDREGKVTFSRIPLGHQTINPVLQQDESSEPSQAEAAVPSTDAVLKVSSFIITRFFSTLHLKTNRPGTLVTVTEGPPSESLPPVSFIRDDTPLVYSTLINDVASIRVTPGNYSLRCWWESSSAGSLVMTPPGGLNRDLIAGDETDASCEFKN